jgi:hypothetical protein
MPSNRDGAIGLSVRVLVVVSLVWAFGYWVGRPDSAMPSTDIQVKGVHLKGATFVPDPDFPKDCSLHILEDRSWRTCVERGTMVGVAE